jgi:hypothetical protein
MSMGQKRFWAQLGIFGALIISWVALFLVNGTAFYWQDNVMKMTFYWFCTAAFATLVIMNVVISIIQKRRREITDERDRAIFRRASLWAAGASYTVVVALLLALSIFNQSQGEETISVNFPLFIVIIGGVALLLTQAIAALIMYGEKVKYA